MVLYPVFWTPIGHAKLGGKPDRSCGWMIHFLGFSTSSSLILRWNVVLNSPNMLLIPILYCKDIKEPKIWRDRAINPICKVKAVLNWSIEGRMCSFLQTHSLVRSQKFTRPSRYTKAICHKSKFTKYVQGDVLEVTVQRTGGVQRSGWIL